MIRQIVLDTETTGLKPELGHRIIEIGAIVIENREITDETFHTYLNPERESDPEALAVHNLTQSFLENKPKFSDIIKDFLMFLTQQNKKTELIIHNAKFDTAFLNAEIKLYHQLKNYPVYTVYKEIAEYSDILDTLKLAQRLHPNQRNSLDALCKRYNVDNTNRKWHGALLDAELLAKVYLKMTAGQPSLLDRLTLAMNDNSHSPHTTENISTLNLPICYASTEELNAHETRLAAIRGEGGICFWEKD